MMRVTGVICAGSLGGHGGDLQVVWALTGVLPAESADAQSGDGTCCPDSQLLRFWACQTQWRSSCGQKSTGPNIAASPWSLGRDQAKAEAGTRDSVSRGPANLANDIGKRCEWLTVEHLESQKGVPLHVRGRVRLMEVEKVESCGI